MNNLLPGLKLMESYDVHLRVFFDRHPEEKTELFMKNRPVQSRC